MLKKHASSPWQQSNSCNQVYKVCTFTCLSVSNGLIDCVELNDTSTLVGHFVSPPPSPPPRKGEKR